MLATPPCTPPAAHAAILEARPLAALRPTLRAGGGVGRILCHDFTRDGQGDMAVTVFSGGTAGDTAWVVFRGDGSHWRLVFRQLDAYKVGLFRRGDDVVESQPLYRGGDPNCCPTGGFVHRRFRWLHGRFAVVRRWHDTRFTAAITPPPIAPLPVGPRVVLLRPLLGDGTALVRWRADRSAGTFDVAVRRRGGAWRTVAARLLRKSYTLRGPPGLQVDVRVRARTVSNLPGAWSLPQRITLRATRARV